MYMLLCLPHTSGPLRFRGCGRLGGTRDVLDLKPLEYSDVDFEAFDKDPNGSAESLKIWTSTTGGVNIWGQLGDYVDPSHGVLKGGRIEQILFADGTFSV